MPSNVIPRGNRFGARVTLAGEEIWLGSFATPEDAREAVKAARSGVLPSAETVAGWAERWPLVAHAVRARSPETIEHTALMARPFVERFGRERVCALRKPALVDWSIDCPGSVRYARTLMADAVWAGLLESNPLNGLRSSGTELEVDPPTEGDVLRLAEYSPEYFRGIVLTAAFSGLRLSEVAALEARDLTFSWPEAGRRVLTLHVRHGKGGKERHSVLFEPGLSALMVVLPEVGRIFSRSLGRSWDRKSVNRVWLRVRERAGLPDCRFHDLRHFHATWLIDRGVSDLDIAIQLGHVDRHGRPDPTQVRKRYAHPSHEAALARVAAVA